MQADNLYYFGIECPSGMNLGRKFGFKLSVALLFDCTDAYNMTYGHYKTQGGTKNDE